nr:immunoglobulin heavy chain junction region [Mus musculus]
CSRHSLGSSYFDYW